MGFFRGWGFFVEGFIKRFGFFDFGDFSSFFEFGSFCRIGGFFFKWFRLDV